MFGAEFAEHWPLSVTAGCPVTPLSPKTGEATPSSGVVTQSHGDVAALPGTPGLERHLLQGGVCSGFLGTIPHGNIPPCTRLHRHSTPVVFLVPLLPPSLLCTTSMRKAPQLVWRLKKQQQDKISHRFLCAKARNISFSQCRGPVAMSTQLWPHLTQQGESHWALPQPLSHFMLGVTG